ncbi:hypothetical protein [Streptomyces avermitilis]|uniref:hypothetical protein n=1 Tax=Streptomyces avermitilis TaxID=33903 RepID=UPI0033B7D2A9
MTEPAASGAAALVTQMVTDGWPQTRDRAAAFLARWRGGDEQPVQGELKVSRAEPVAARDSGDDATAAGAQAEWCNGLRRPCALTRRPPSNSGSCSTSRRWSTRK